MDTSDFILLPSQCFHSWDTDILSLLQRRCKYRITNYTVLAKADFRVRSCPYLNVVTRVLSHTVRNIDWDPTALVTSPRPSDLFNCAFCLLWNSLLHRDSAATPSTRVKSVGVVWVVMWEGGWQFVAGLISWCPGHVARCLSWLHSSLVTRDARDSRRRR